MGTSIFLLMLSRAIASFTEAIFAVQVFELAVVCVVALAVVMIVMSLLRGAGMSIEKVVALVFAAAVGLACFGQNLKVEWHRAPVNPAGPNAEPEKKRKPLLPWREDMAEADPIPKGKSIVAGPSYKGEEVTCDLAPQEQFKNIGSKKDGAGMCVFTSIEMAARYQGIDEMRGWRDWAAANYAGGGYPTKVDALLATWFKLKGIAPIPYIQYEGKAPEAVLELADKTGRMICMTYGYSPRYGNGRIYHMTCSPRYRGQLAVCLDNNFVAKKSGDGYDENDLEWMSKEELVRRIRYADGSAWIFVWLSQPPAPIPWTS